VLLSAFAFAPGRGSEAGVGWNAAGALARHHDVWVLTEGGARPLVEARLRESPVHGLSVSFLDLPGPVRRRELDDRRIDPRYPRWQRAALAEARRLHAEVGFDVVHHLTPGRYWPPSSLWKLKVPFVLGPVGGGETAPRAFRPDYGRRGWVYEAARDARRWLREHDPRVRRMVRRAAACLTATDETTVRLQALGARRIVRVPGQAGLSADDLALFEHLAVRDPATPRFVAVSHLTHGKGIPLAIRALAASDLRDATLDVIGDGPERERLEAEAEALGVGDRVRLLGVLPRTEALARLARATALVHPALHDFSPLAVLEAMGLGKPVLALRLNGPATQVSAETGITVPAPDPETAVHRLAEGMRSLSRDPALRQRLGIAALAQANTEYTWAHKAELFSRVYRQVTAEAAHA
jgi:glycosyltransferase involved in cell wall biosynthesis